jgi:hypothetical protein
VGNSDNGGAAMNRFCWRLAGFASRLLEPDERNAVQGDLIESGANGADALRDIIGLVTRRQLALWKGWQPWLALLGVDFISAVVLSAAAFNLRVGIDHRLLRYLKSGTYYDESGITVHQEIIFMLCLAAAFLAWTWTSGFVLARLSHRSLWLTGLTFYVVVLNCFLARLVATGAIDARYPIVGDRPYPLPLVFLAFLLPFTPSKLLFLFAFISGAHTGLRKCALRLRTAAAWAIFVIVATALVMWSGEWFRETHSLIVPWIGTSPASWTGGVWHAGPWPTRLWPLLLASWPVVYMLVTSWRCRNESARQF